MQNGNVKKQEFSFAGLNQIKKCRNLWTKQNLQKDFSQYPSDQNTLSGLHRNFTENDTYTKR